MKPHFGSDTDSSDEEAPGGEGCQGIAETSGSRTRHWGSSSSEEEEDEEERDEGKVPADPTEQEEKPRDPIVSEKPLKITRLPKGLKKPLAKLEVSVVEQLKTFYVPPSQAGKRGTLFYRSTQQPLWREEMEDPAEYIFERVKIPRYYSPKMKELLERSGYDFKQSYARAKFFQRMWNPPQRRAVLPDGRVAHTRGLGFGRPTTFTCNVVRRFVFRF